MEKRTEIAEKAINNLAEISRESRIKKLRERIYDLNIEMRKCRDDIENLTKVHEVE